MLIVSFKKEKKTNVPGPYVASEAYSYAWLVILSVSWLAALCFCRTGEEEGKRKKGEVRRREDLGRQ